MATPATAGAEAAHKAGFPPFQVETYPGQLLWFAIAFGLLYWLLSKHGLPVIGETLHKRSQRIASDLDEADAMRSKAQEAEQAYEAAIAEARTRAKALSQETSERLAKESETRRHTVEAELATKLAEAEATISARTNEAMESVRGIAADTAQAIIERLTGRLPEPAVIEAALDRSSLR
jgi:F-type H+-transporting ATPase subunit b